MTFRQDKIVKLKKGKPQHMLKLLYIYFPLIFRISADFFFYPAELCRCNPQIRSNVMLF